MENFFDIFMIAWNELFNLTISFGENLSFSLGGLMIAGFAFTIIIESLFQIFWGD